MTETIEIQLKKGVLGLCVLALLNRADSYAYEIASRLSDAIGMGEGTIYPLMRRMQSDGQVETYLVESSAGPSRSSLAPAGTELNSSTAIISRNRVNFCLACRADNLNSASTCATSL